MAHRAAKSGLAAEAQRKIEGKYDAEEARKCLVWIKTVCPEIEEIASDPDASHDGFWNTMKDGMVLCKLTDKLMPGKINWNDKTFQVPKIEAMRVMRERERIAMFTKLSQQFGVPEVYSFPTESLTDKVALNLAQVCVCIRALGIEAQDRGVGPSDYWPKKSQGQKREWTDEQLRAGQATIGLQMGSNKGASQAGMNIGKSRHIID